MLHCGLWYLRMSLRGSGLTTDQRAHPVLPQLPHCAHDKILTQNLLSYPIALAPQHLVGDWVGHRYFIRSQERTNFGVRHLGWCAIADGRV